MIIWREWLESDGLIFPLLLPVRHNEVCDLNRIKQEVAGLSKAVEVKQEVA
jgi:hypothetical protein